MAALAVATAVTSGCAVYEQVQYFAASDPETGVTNYYRMTVSGWGGGGTDYHLQAGYFSAAAVDMLRGSMPNIPILDLSVEQQEVFDRLAQQFYAALIQEAKRRYKVTDTEALLIATQSQRANVQERIDKLEDRLDRNRVALAPAAKDVIDLTGTCDSAADALQTDQKAYETALAAYESDPKNGAPTTSAPAGGQATKTNEQKYKGAKETRDEARVAFREAQRKLDSAIKNRDRLRRKVESIEAQIASSHRTIAAASRLSRKLADSNASGTDADKDDQAKLPPFGDPEVVALARLVWFGSLTKSDIASIGMNQTADPFQFRKLVFWATANNIDLNQYAGQIDAVIDNVVAIASTYKNQAKARKQARKSRRESFKDVVGGLNLGQNADVLNSLYDLMVPPPAESATVPPEGGAQ